MGAEGARDKILQELKVPGPERIWYVGGAFRHGFTLDEVFAATNIDRWFLIQIEDIIKTENQIKTLGFGDLNADNIRAFKRKGLSDLRIADLMGISQNNSVNTVGTWASLQFTNVWIHVLQNSNLILLICTQLMMKSVNLIHLTATRSW